MPDKQLEKIDPPALPEPVTPMQMLATAHASGADPDTLEKFMLMAERAEDRQAKRDYLEAFQQFSLNAPKILKTRAGNKWKFANLENVVKAVRPVMNPLGLSWRFTQTQEGKRVIVTCVLSHIGGHSEECAAEGDNDTSGSKNDIQSVGSAVSYLRRFALLGVLGLSTEDDDGSGGMGGTQTITAEQKQELIDLIKSGDVDLADFLLYGEVKSLDEIPSQNFAGAKAILVRRGKKT